MTNSESKKTCKECQNDFTQSDMHKQLKNYCKPCASKLRSKWYREKQYRLRNMVDTDLTKQCSMCRQTREIKFFNERTGKRCIDCHNRLRREKEQSKKTSKITRKIKLSDGVKKELRPDVRHLDPCENKVCVTCKILKSTSEYYALNANRCCQCTKEYEKNIRKELKNKREHVLKNSIDNGDSVKNCEKCNKEKPLEMFSSKYKDCKDCMREKWRKYRQSDKGKENAKKWSEENKDRMKELQSQHYQRNKSNRNEKYKENMANDLSFKLKKIYQRRLLNCLGSKSKKTLEYLGCSASDLNEWFTSQFTDKMTSDNHGSYWHIDHVIPISLYDMSNETNQHLILQWFNMTPLKAEENMNKKNKIDQSQLKQHVKEIKKYSKQKNIDIPKEYFELCAKHLTMFGKPLKL